MSFEPRGSRAGRAPQAEGYIKTLVLRAWLEPDGRPPLRVRLVEIEPGRADRPVAVTTSIDEACQAVSRWLQTLQERKGGR
jgi:hypothetical protein